MPKRKPQIDGLFLRVLHILGQEKYCSWITRLLQSTALLFEVTIQQETMSLYGTCVSCSYRFKAFLLPVTTVKGHHVFSLELLSQNGSHKLTVCCKVYCTY